MAQSVRVRLDEEVYAALSRQAVEAGVTVAELLRQAAARLVLDSADSRLSMGEWLERTRRARSGLTRDDVLEALDEIRGPWPEPER